MKSAQKIKKGIWALMVLVFHLVNFRTAWTERIAFGICFGLIKSTEIESCVECSQMLHWLRGYAMIAHSIEKIIFMFAFIFIFILSNWPMTFFCNIESKYNSIKFQWNFFNFTIVQCCCWWFFCCLDSVFCTFYFSVFVFYFYCCTMKGKKLTFLSFRFIVYSIAPHSVWLSSIAVHPYK